MTTVNKYHTGVTIIGASLLALGIFNYRSKNFSDKPATIEQMVLGGGIILFGNMGVAMADAIIHAKN